MCPDAAHSDGFGCSAKALCTASEIGVSYAALASSVGDGAYPTFFCGTPAAEPSCVPERRQSVSGSGVYTGAITADDSDGDGINDADDDCPSVFDPIVPLGALSTSFEYLVLAPGSATLTATLDAITLSASVTGIEPSHLVINEVDYDQVGNDTAECIEIYNSTGAPVSLANHSLVFVNGANGASYRSVNLAPAGILAAGEYLVVARPSVIVPTGSSRLDLPAAGDNLQNGCSSATGAGGCGAPSR